MSDEELTSELESSAAEATYAFQFRRHLADFRAHLAGVDGDNLRPSFIPPTGYWTPSEKETFFRSLTVFSRFRPDLIAARIGTKTVMDVSTYIDSLDVALARSRHLISSRKNFDIAIDVSGDWVGWEDKMAEVLTALEPQWESETVSVQREEEVSTKQARLRAAAVGHVGEDEREGWELDLRRRWNQEDALKQLSVDHLRVLEGILREGDSVSIDLEDSPADDVYPEGQQSKLALPSPKTQPPAPPVQPSAISDEMIDPILLELSGLPVPRSRKYSPVQPASAAQCPEKSFCIPSDPLPLLPTNAFLQSALDSHSPGPEDEQAVLGASALSPASRRRFQKRLYMRRKRAAERGEEVVAIVAKLRPGRKGNTKLPTKSKRKTSGINNASRNDKGAESGGISMDIEQDADSTAATSSTNILPSKGLAFPKNSSEHQNEEEQEDDTASESARNIPGGLTKPYKIKKQFAAKGINADVLMEGNLGLFHLSTLSRFMTLYKTGYNTGASPVASLISADTISLMTTIIVEFTTEAVQRSIISCEQEKRMKGDIKVWGKSHDEITLENVDHALEIMGMKGMTRENYFAELLGEDIQEPLEEEDSDGNLSDDDDDSDLDEDNDSMNEDTQDKETDGDALHRQDWPTFFPALLPLHREVHPPIVHLPKFSYGCAQETAKENLMAVDTDKEELEKELQEEMELDKSDKKKALECELELWKQFGLEKKTPKRNNDRAS